MNELVLADKGKKNLFQKFTAERWTVEHYLKRNVRKHPNDVAYIFEGKELSWKAFDNLVDVFAFNFLSEGFNSGEGVALMVENRLEFLIILFALNRIGIAPGLINTSLTGQGLAHCINEIHASRIIFGCEVETPVAEVADLLEYIDNQGFYIVPDGNDIELEGHPWAKVLVKPGKDTARPEIKSLVRNDATCCYIFTSGTTGLPKASKISHDRWFKASLGFKLFSIKTKRSDRYYLCLPLFHGNALFVGIGSAILGGASVFLRRKFSASNFLKEARTYQTNTFIYIGELCRYLLHSEQSNDDWDNPIVKCAGNGLKPEIWEEFKTRFGLKRMGEFYASTEGNVAFMNYFNKSQTIGISPASFKLAKYDVLNDELVTDKNGFCIEVEKGEPGLLLSEVNRFIPFEGYTRPEDTENKLVRNAFKKQDVYFNTGDLIKKVDVGFSFGISHYQFVDRIGDTFRWKGENVSTNEVEAILNAFPDVKHSNVYGVEIPHTNGKAGMAAIVLNDEHSDIRALDTEALSEYIVNKLPAYARPVFVRILEAMETTGTFKMVKGDLKKEGFDPSSHQDKTYVLLPNESSYSLLDSVTYQKIMNGFISY